MIEVPAAALLSGNNNVTVEFVNGQTCHAAFAYTRQPGTQVAIRNVVCQ
ncbi:hypothetical protein [Phyllobacterium endophyticum]|nr:hypothetical protein [Phyllobacterium endophyticum]